MKMGGSDLASKAAWLHGDAVLNAGLMAKRHFIRANITAFSASLRLRE